MNSIKASQVVETFLDRISTAGAGQPTGDPFELFHPEFSYTAGGETPVSGTYNTVEEIQKDLMLAMERLAVAPGYFLYITEMIVDDNRVVVIARNRGASRKSMPYNNQFFFLFEIKDGKIKRMFELLDSSIFMTAVWDTHIEP